MPDIPTNIPHDNPDDDEFTYTVDWDKLEAEARKRPEWQARFQTEVPLPIDWERLSLDELWRRLNSQGRKQYAPQVVVDAIHWSLIYGRGSLRDSLQQLARLSLQQKTSLCTALRKADKEILAVEIERLP